MVDSVTVHLKTLQCYLEETDLLGRYMFQVVEFVGDIIWGDTSVGDSNKPRDILECGFQGEKCPGE